MITLTSPTHQFGFDIDKVYNSKSKQYVVNSIFRAWFMGICWAWEVYFEASEGSDFIHYELTCTIEQAADLGCKMISEGYQDAGRWLVKQAIKANKEKEMV